MLAVERYPLSKTFLLFANLHVAKLQTEALVYAMGPILDCSKLNK